MKSFFFLIIALLLPWWCSSQVYSDSIEQSLKMIGLQFTRSEIDSLRKGLSEQLQDFREIRKQDIPNHLPLSLSLTFPAKQLMEGTGSQSIDWGITEEVQRPQDLDELAFFSVAELSVLIRTRQVTSMELTSLFIKRLQQYGDTLQCVITITDSLALAQARRADQELASGIYRGPLHGIPYGAKDLLAVPGYPTTWGAEPYKDQRLNYSATVIDKLEAAGAVLVAKLTLGALAWGDVWYGGLTKNPWNPEQGSSGSSAGSAAAEVAGLVPFAIGSETWGSIVSPVTRCGATGLRPTFGSVSRYGAMTLSWSMDKLGPITRNALDAAIVYDAIRGMDPKDLSTVHAPFPYIYPLDWHELRIGYLKELFGGNGKDSATLQLLKDKGLTLVPKSLPEEVPVSSLSFILTAEAAAAFDDLTRSNRDDLLVRQIIDAWPNVFRSARFIPAVEYIQANRLRARLIGLFNQMMADIDVLIAPSFGGDQLLMTNLTGHPCVVIPNASYASEKGGTITLIGNHFDEAAILAFARYIQSFTPYEEEHPESFR